VPTTTSSNGEARLFNHSSLVSEFQVEQKQQFMQPADLSATCQWITSSSNWTFQIIIIIIITIRIYYGAAQPVLSSALQYNNVIVDSGN